MGAPIVVTAVVTGTGSSLLALERWLARELGFYLATTVTTQASGGDAARVVIAEEIRDDESGYTFLGKPWVYVRTGAQAGTQRRVLDDPDAGYQGARSAVLVSRPFAAPLAVPSVVEFTAPLPVRSHLGIRGLRECIQSALELIRVQVRLDVVGNGTYEYDLASYPIYQAGQIVGISDQQYDPASPALESPYLAELVVDGVDRTLVTRTAYSTADTFRLDLIVSADRLVSDGTTWTFIAQNGTTGLQGDAYQTAAPENWVRQFAMREALAATIDLVEASDLPDAQKDRRIQRLREQHRMRSAAAARIKLLEFPRPRPGRAEPLVITPSTIGWV